MEAVLAALGPIGPLSPAPEPRRVPAGEAAT